MIKGSLAKRYARALMYIGQEQGVYERLGRELDQIAGLAASDLNLRLALKTPIVSHEVRAKIIGQICGVIGTHELTLNFLKLLNDKGRLGQLEQIAAAYRDLADEAEGRVRAEVITAAPLSGDGSARLQAALANITGKQVVMNASVDQSIIGGVITRVAGLLLDGSVKTQLAAMRERLRTAGEL